METLTPIQPHEHKHARLWLVITILVVVVAIGGVGYYAYRTKQLKNGSVAAAPTTVAVEPAPVTPAPVAATTSPSVTAVSQASNDLNSVNVKDLTSAVTELKTVTAAFNR